MTLLTAHKILITSAVALFVFCSGWELRKYVSGDASALLPAAGSVVAALSLTGYLRWLWLRRRIGGKR